MVVRILSI